MSTDKSLAITASAIAAVNIGPKIRLFYQNIGNNIVEATYDGGWKTTNVFSVASQNSPLAAVLKNGIEAHIFYITPAGALGEIISSEGKAWGAGGLDANKFVVAPSSKLAVGLLPASGGIRLYTQNTNNTIQEFGNDSGSTWFKSATNLGVALAGTALAVSVFSQPALSIRVYFQTADLKLFQKLYDLAANKWVNGADTNLTIPAQSSVSVAQWGSTTLFNRLFTITSSNKVLQGVLDNNVAGSGTELSPALAGTQSAVVAWGSSESGNLEMRAYWQDGTGAGIAEFIYGASGFWHKGAQIV